ncbi:MAG: hypothetical protein A2W11_00320 [Ignavibacteria bacterium RBG_16_35_7]|nr:MAG: hypothetical protein A2W11_00320 [Ignavibacteria bacterium RBG_16_35_7]
MIEFQLDYGGYDSRFLGIVLKFFSRESFDLFSQISGATPENVIKIGNRYLLLDESKFFQFCSVSTILPHELRHYHDSLLSPYSNMLFRLRIMSAINGSVLTNFLFQHYELIPVPLEIWLKKPFADKSKRIAWWTKKTNIDRDKLFIYPPNEVEKNINIHLKTYEAIGELVKNKNILDNEEVIIRPFQVFEASAVITQLQNIYNVFGEQHFDGYLDSLNKSDKYTIVLTLLLSLYLQRKENPHFVPLSAIVFWCLMGDYRTDKFKACPSYRFKNLYEYLKTHRLPSKGSNFSDFFEEWSMKLDLSRIEDSFESILVSNEKFENEVKNTVVKNKDTYEEFLKFLALHNLAVKEMIRIYKHDPIQYINTYEYVNNLSHWVAAPIMIEFPFNSKKFIFSIKEIEQNYNVRISKLIDKNTIDLRRAVAYEQFGGKVVFENSELNANMFDEMVLSDFFFSKLSRDSSDFEFVRQAILKPKNKYCPELY